MAIQVGDRVMVMGTNNPVLIGQTTWGTVEHGFFVQTPYGEGPFLTKELLELPLPKKKEG